MQGGERDASTLEVASNDNGAQATSPTMCQDFYISFHSYSNYNSKQY